MPEAGPITLLPTPDDRAPSRDGAGTKYPRMSPGVGERGKRMSHRPEFVRWCEQEIATLREELSALTSGSSHLVRGQAGGPWVDVSAEEIRRVTAAIENLEALLRAEPA
jgi:hypothetical protein